MSGRRGGGLVQPLEETGQEFQVDLVVAEVLALAQGLRLALATNAADSGPADIRAALARCGLSDRKSVV